MTKRQRMLLWAAFFYFTFLGGTVYTELNVIPRLLHHVIVTVMLVAWLWGMLRGRRVWPQTALDGAMALFTIWLFVGAAFALDVRVALEYVWPSLIHALGFYLLIDLMRRGWQRHIMEALFLAGAVAVLLTGVEMGTWYFGIPLVPQFRQGWFEIGGLSDPIPPMIHRAALAMTHPTALSAYMALLLPVSVAWAMTARQRDHRIGLWMLAIGALVCEVLSFSRGGMLAVGVSVAMMIAFAARRMWRKLGGRPLMGDLMGKAWSVAALALLIMVSILAIGLAAFKGWQMYAEGHISGDRVRMDLWRSALEMAGDDPITGVGPRMYGVALRTYREEAAGREKIYTAHNVYLHTLAELGLPGLAALIWMGAAFIVTWRKHQKAAYPSLRLRLEGVMAALTGFAAQCLVDTFEATPIVLTVMVYAAYALTHPSGSGAPRPDSGRWPIGRALPAVAVAVLIAYLAGSLALAPAELAFNRSVALGMGGDWAGALEAVESACAGDPWLGLYAFQRAYVLGQLASESPDEYLDAAIEAHLDALSRNPTFETAHVNLAALYAQNGDLIAAVGELEAALESDYQLATAWVKLGEYRERIGIERGFTEVNRGATNAYLSALEVAPHIVGSRYWDDPGFPARQAAIQALIEESTPGDALAIAMRRGDMALAEEYADDVQADIPGPGAAEALIRYYLAAGEPEEALEVADEAVAMFGETAQAVPVWVARAEVLAELGRWDEAVHDARLALFLEPIGGARANRVLALDARRRGDSDEYERLMALAVPPRVVSQNFEVVVYGRPAMFEYLPQVAPPGPGYPVLDPWLELADWYESHEMYDEAADVLEAILRYDAYMEIGGDR